MKYFIFILTMLSLINTAYSQTDSLSANKAIGITSNNLFTDYGVYFSNQASNSITHYFKLFYSFNDFRGTESFYVSGGGIAYQFQYTRKPKTNNSYWLVGIKYRHIEIDSVYLYDSGYRRYSYSLNGNEYSISAGWGKNWLIDPIVLCFSFGVDGKYMVDKQFNKEIIEEWAAYPLSLENTIGTKFIPMPFIDVSIGYRF